MATDKFRVLRGEMKSHALDVPYLASLCGVKSGVIYAAIRGEREWPLEWMYITMDALGLPYSTMAKLFPRGGMYAGELDCRTPTPADHLAAAIDEYIRATINTHKEVTK